MNITNKRGFTIIELLITIAVLSILVLIGSPRLLGYTDKAELTRIQHDVKVVEQKMQSEILNSSFDKEFKSWQNNAKDLGALIMNEQLFEKEGVSRNIDASHLSINGTLNLNRYNREIASVDKNSSDNEDMGIGGEIYLLDSFDINKTYKIVPRRYSDEIETRLNGTFYTNSEGKVYYEHNKPLTNDENYYLDCPLPYPDSDYEFEIKNEKGTITKWHGEETYITIPEAFKMTVDGNEKCVPVQVIGTGAFMRGGFKSIIIPQSVTIIEDDAFKDNQLSEVIIPHSVEYIGQNAFDSEYVNGTNQFEVIINRKRGSVEYGPGERHFGNYEPTYRTPTPKDLEVVFYPETGEILANTRNKKVINIPEYLHVGGVDYPVKKINKGAYQGAGLISVILPESLERIEDYAFSGNQLEGITIPDKVNHIGNYAFAFNEVKHSRTGRRKGTIGFVNIKGQDRFENIDKFGNISDSSGNKIENLDGVNMLDHIFVISNGNYVITEDYVGKNEIIYDGEDNSNREGVAIREPNNDETPIYTIEDLNNVRNNLSDKYILMSDIDLENISWEPIGVFDGELDGNGFSISNLNIEKTREDSIGFFKQLRNSKVANLRLNNVNITGPVSKSNGANVGGLAGQSSSSILENVHISGIINGRTNNGGLVGNAFKTEIINSSFVGEVNGDGWRTGGLVGHARGSSSIKSSYVRGTVRGEDRYSGGLVGGMDSSYDDTSIENSYFRGNVFGSVMGGALVGGFGGSSATGGRNYQTVKNSYAVTGPSTNNLFGTRSSLTHSINVIWDINTSESSDDDEYVGEFGLTTEEMMKKESYMNKDYGNHNFGPWTAESWDFENVWQIDEGKSYPYLRDNPQ